MNVKRYLDEEACYSRLLSMLTSKTSFNMQEMRNVKIWCKLWMQIVGTQKTLLKRTTNCCHVLLKPVPGRSKHGPECL